MANFNMNKVILGGRLTADPELRKTPQDLSVTSFTVAVNRRFSRGNEGQQTADFINCVAWRQTAESISQYFHKGSSICITGSLQVRKWTDQNGQNRYSTEVIVDEFYFVDAKNDGASYTGAVPSYSTPDASAADPAQFEELSSDDDLPF